MAAGSPETALARHCTDIIFRLRPGLPWRRTRNALLLFHEILGALQLEGMQ
jgi:hypothetical protein